VSAWKTASLGEIFDIARGGSPRPIQDYITDDEDGVNWISISDASASDKFITETKKRIRPEGVSRSRMVKPGDFLLTNSMSFGRPYIMGTSGCIHDGWLVLSSKHGDVDQDYFFHLLGSDFIYAKFTKLAAGATVKNLNIDLVSGVEVNFPPLEEQRRLAAILDQAETLRTQRRQALAHLDTLTQSLFLDMFGDPVANPKEWGRKPFGAVCETRLGKMLDAKQQTGANSRKYLRNANVQWFHIDTSDLLEMDFDADARGTFRLHSGDLLICEGGEPGRAAIWRGELEDVYYQKALHRGRPKSDLVNAEYLVWLLWFLSKRGGLGDHVTAATIAHLTGEKLKAMAIPVPPLALQQTFATRIQAIESLKATHRTALAQLDALFASLQQRAFNGEL
jgi:type I restriction enzyme, S subunit